MFCRVSRAWEFCAFVSMHAIISLDVSDVPDVVKKLMRFSLMDSCLPSNACNRKTIVHSLWVGAVSSKIVAMLSLMSVMVELKVEGSANRVDRIA